MSDKNNIYLESLNLNEDVKNKLRDKDLDLDTMFQNFIFNSFKKYICELPPTEDNLEKQEQGQELATPEEQKSNIIFKKSNDKKIKKLKNDFIALDNNFILGSVNMETKEYKLLFLVLYKLQNNYTFFDDKLLLEYIEINSSEINLWLKIYKDEYHYIKKLSDKFISRNIKIYNDKEHTFINFNLFSSIRYIKGSLFIVPTQELKNFIKVSSNFTKVSFFPLFQLQNKYSSRLFLLLSKFNQNSLNFEISYFRELFQIEKKYLNNRDLKKSVIDVAVDELNSLFKDLNLKYELVRTDNSRFYKKIIFTFNHDKLNFESDVIKSIKGAFEKCFNICSYGSKCSKYFRKNDKACLYCKQFLFNDNIKPF